MSRYLLGIDQSTQGTKALLFNEEGDSIARCDLPHRQIIDDKGWVEHDLEEILHNTVEVAKMVIEQSGIDKSEVVGIGISNQRETAAVWDRASGKPVYNAIVWQCARGAQICAEIEQAGHADQIKRATGLNLSPYFSAAKIAWVLRNCPGAQQRAREGALCCGTIDSWLVYRLTGGASFKTDYSNASRTQLFNISTLRWDEEVCGWFDIPVGCLAEVCGSDSLFGETDLMGFFDHPIPIHGVLGDSHAALFGQGCHRPGMIKTTYGTGSSVMMNIGEKPIFDKDIVTSLAWCLGGRVEYVLEGNINYTGAVITWLKNDLKLVDSAKVGPIAEAANPADKTYLVPAFSGLGAPYWDSSCTAMITGMTRNTGRAEIVRAAEECIAYQIADNVNLLSRSAGIPVRELRVDGGPTRDRFLMQFQSDILDTVIQVPQAEELSAIGAAYAAGIALGVFDRSRIFERMERKAFTPKMDPARRSEKYDGWKAAVARVLAKPAPVK